MASRIHLSLTNELRSFVDNQCGDHGPYATPSETRRDFLRERKARQEAAALREAVFRGYQDAIAGRTVEFNGNLREALKAGEERNASNWK